MAVPQFKAPTSKSHAQRILLASALAKESSIVSGITSSGDVDAMLKIIHDLGSDVTHQGGNMYIVPGKIRSRQLDCGESGLAIRLLASVCASLGGDYILHASGSLQKRSLKEFEYFIPQLGVECATDNGHAPISISGKAQFGKVVIGLQDSSQYLSGLLMALPLLEGDSHILFDRIDSRPYVDLTIDVLKTFGIRLDVEDTFIVIPGNQTYRATGLIEVEGDWSAAANFAVLGAITNGIRISGLNSNSNQADKAILNVFDRSGVTYFWKESDLLVEPGKIRSFEFDATNCPDLFPVLTVFAAAAKGKSMIHGAGRLVNKESNRADVLKNEFAKANLHVELDETSLIIHGTSTLKSTVINANNDHRIAMAGAIASALTPNGMRIAGTEAVNKSFPGFWVALNVSE